MKIKKVEWCLAYRKRQSRLLADAPDRISDFKIIKNSARYWCADPFVIKDGECNYVFFEMYDRLKRKGEIGYRKIDAQGNISSLKKAFEDECHLSYPFIFKKDGDYYIIPESSGKRQLYLLKATNFPDRWKIDKILMDDIRLVDTTLLEYRGQVYMFTTPIVEDNVSNLSVCRLKDGIFEREEAVTTVIKDKSRARMGGAFIMCDGEIIRVSQDCSHTYGGGLVFSKISLQQDRFSEEIVSTIEGKNLMVDGKKFDGIHTYNCNGDYEFIDLKIDRKFNILECVGYLRNKIVASYRKIFRKNK